MCVTCQAVNPFSSACFLNHDVVVFQDVSETTDARNTVHDAGGEYVLNVGDSFHGYLSADDRDVLEIQLEAGAIYTFSLGASSQHSDSVLDTHLGLYNRNGAYLTPNDDIDYTTGNTYSEITFVASYTGTYFLEVSTYKTIYGVTGVPHDIGFYSLTTAATAALAPLPVFTSDQIAHQLTYVGWGDRTYAWDVSPGESLTVRPTGLTSEGQMLARNALEAWTNVTGIGFVEVFAGGQIVFDDNNSGAYATFNSFGNTITTASVNVSTSWLASYGTELNTYSFQTYVHEVGHALGLAHAGNYNGSASYGDDNHYLNDSWQQTVMSYFSQSENTYVDAFYAFVITPQNANIIAAQSLYGSSGAVRTEDSTYGYNSNIGGYYDQLATLTNTAFTIVDDGGTDTLDASGYGGTQFISLFEETYSDAFGETGNLGIARGTTIENFIGGSGADLVMGNAADNLLHGNDGADQLYAGLGNDTVYGGEGADRLVGNEGDDSLFGGAGDDIIKGKFGNNALHGEDGDDRMEGSNSGDDLMFGGEGTDTLTGLDGNDTIYGDAGTDYLYGGRGNDIVSGREGDDVVRGNRNLDTLYGGAGSDKIYGGGDADALFGNEDRDFLLGEGGNDTLDGGTGDDNLTGGAGSDVFVFATGYGFDRIKDFENGVDLIKISGTQAKEFSDLSISETAGNVRVAFGNGDVIILIISPLQIWTRTISFTEIY